MGVVLPFLRQDDDLWETCPNVVEIASAASDEDATAVGTTPWSGDRSSTGLHIPPAPTTAQTNRYLFRLCGVEIPVGYSILIKGLRQVATLRSTEEINGQPRILEREIVSPLWRFQDGNISWHLRLQTQQFAPTVFDPAQIAGTSPDMRALDSGLLYRPPLVPYVALGAGQPPGVSVGDLGTWRDIRYPWDESKWTLSELVRGPGAVVFYASVHQPDPANRPQYPTVRGLRPEDQFLGNFPNAIYGHIGGSMIFEMMPCCDEQRKKGKRPA